MMPPLDTQALRQAILLRTSPFLLLKNIFMFQNKLEFRNVALLYYRFETLSTFGAFFNAKIDLYMLHSNVTTFRPDG